MEYMELFGLLNKKIGLGDFSSHYPVGSNNGLISNPFQAKINRGMPEDDKSILYLVLQLLGLGIVNYALMQNDLNEMATKTTAE